MNIRDIAKRAKVSAATVSRTINRAPTVDPRTAKRVWKAIDRMGYRPNIQARALVSGRSHILGLVVSEVTSPFFQELVQAFETMAVEHGYEILLVSTARDAIVRRMTERRVDGVAVMTCGMEDLLLGDADLRNLPLIFLEGGRKRPRVSNISIDYLSGMRHAVQHLAALRHEHIGFISGPVHLQSAVCRRDAFEEAMNEIGLEQVVVEGDHTFEGGIRAMQLLCCLPKRPTAVVCSNDMTALGVMRNCYKEGFSIPGDLSLVGFDDINLAQFVVPPLTTVRISQSELARIAFHALATELEHGAPAEHGTEYLLQTGLVLRESTALAPVWLSQQHGEAES